jgi:cystathionine gamma-synthase
VDGRNDDWAPRTKAAQALGWIDERTKALTPPVHPSSTFIRDPDNRYRAGYGYARDENPSFDQAEALLAELEGGEAALLFASGMAAATAVFQTLRAGDHVVAQEVMYWGLRKWLGDFARRWSVEVEFVPAWDNAALAAAVRSGKTRLVWVETPANPMWQVVDIAAAAEIAHRAGARLAVDGTVATPILTRPLALGADLVMHSATKYLNGHSDLIAGALVTARQDEAWAALRAQRHDGGAVLGPFEAWLLLRGMRTLALRVPAASESALHIAQHLLGNANVAEVLYPGLASHPGHDVARRQMQGGFGGMLSIRVVGGEAAAIAAAARVRLWKRATSLGGVESLIEHRASVEGPGTPVPSDLLRLSVGIEDPADLIADLEQALAARG